MKTFKDLEWKSHDTCGGLCATLDFDNGYGVSVVTGSWFYSTGVHENYELAIMDENGLVYGELTGYDVAGYLEEDELDELIRKVQALEPNSYGTGIEERV